MNRFYILNVELWPTVSGPTCNSNSHNLCGFATPRCSHMAKHATQSTPFVFWFVSCCSGIWQVDYNLVRIIAGPKLSPLLSLRWKQIRSARLSFLASKGRWGSILFDLEMWKLLTFTRWTPPSLIWKGRRLAMLHEMFEITKTYEFCVFFLNVLIYRFLFINYPLIT